jgi:hypothetical protein
MMEQIIATDALRRVGQRCGMTPDDVNPDRPEQR